MEHATRKAAVLAVAGLVLWGAVARGQAFDEVGHDEAAWGKLMARVYGEDAKDAALAALEMREFGTRVVQHLPRFGKVLSSLPPEKAESAREWFSEELPEAVVEGLKQERESAPPALREPEKATDVSMLVPPMALLDPAGAGVRAELGDLSGWLSLLAVRKARGEGLTDRDARLLVVALEVPGDEVAKKALGGARVGSLGTRLLLDAHAGLRGRLVELVVSGHGHGGGVAEILANGWPVSAEREAFFLARVSRPGEDEYVERLTCWQALASRARSPEAVAAIRKELLTGNRHFAGRILQGLQTDPEPPAGLVEAVAGRIEPDDTEIVVPALYALEAYGPRAASALPRLKAVRGKCKLDDLAKRIAATESKLGG